MIEWWGWLVLAFFLFLLAEGLVCGVCQYRARYGSQGSSSTRMRPTSTTPADPHHVGSNQFVNGGIEEMKSVHSSGSLTNISSPTISSTKFNNNNNNNSDGDGGHTTSYKYQQQGKDTLKDFDLTPYRPNAESIGGGQPRAAAATAGGGYATPLIGRALPPPTPPSSGDHLPPGGGMLRTKSVISSVSQSGSTSPHHQSPLHPISRQRSVTIRDVDSNDGEASFVNSLTDSRSGGFVDDHRRSSTGPVYQDGSLFEAKEPTPHHGGMIPPGLLPTPPSQQSLTDHHHHGNAAVGRTDSVLTTSTTSPRWDSRGFPSSSMPSSQHSMPPLVAATPNTTEVLPQAASPPTVRFNGAVLTEDEIIDSL